MLHKTKGVVLRTIKYGETSIVATLYTELFGLQSYLVNSVRAATKKGTGKAVMFQPASLLDLVVYQNELKNLQRIREFHYAQIYQHIFFDVFKNAVALFMVELISKCVKQPESNPELFYFMEDGFLRLDEADETVVGNFPLYFGLNLAGFFGFRIQDDYTAERSILDLQEGQFVAAKPPHPYLLTGSYSASVSELLKVMQPAELIHVRLNQETRRILMTALQNFYALHIPDFGAMKTLPVLQTVFSS